MAKRFSVILELLNLAKAKVGKTFLQKAIYILQDWLNLDLGYDYKLYLYGPYSEDLSEDIDILRDAGLIDVGIDATGYGYNIAVNDKGARFLSKNLDTYIVDRGKLDKVISFIGTSDVKNMELLSTILYLAKTTADKDQTMRLMQEIKPQFNSEQIDRKVEELQRQGILVFPQ
ncbi:MAG: hypothetical protein R6U93_08690 [Dehalococcoidia bacterium]